MAWNNLQKCACELVDWTVFGKVLVLEYQRSLEDEELSRRFCMEVPFENVYDSIKVNWTLFDISKRVKNFHAYLTRNYSQKNVHVCGLIGQYSPDCQR